LIGDKPAPVQHLDTEPVPPPNAAVLESALSNEPPEFDPTIYAQNWENARHLRTVRVLSANAFAVVIAACLTALQLVRADRLVELTTLGFLVAVAAIQLLISLALKRELDDCMVRIERQVAGTRHHGLIGLLPSSGVGPGWLHLRWLYTGFYVATLVALLITFVHRLWA
jgi:hypothetical protein